MNLNYAKTHFIQSAGNIHQCPTDRVKEVAFAGRSNAGKSSAINALTGSKKLARTSKTPGRTQLINFFAVETNRFLVDLPGYGYAKVSRNIKEKWQQDLSEYLHKRQSLQGLILLMDIRHPLQDFDQMVLEWSSASELPIHILLTKADKFKKGPAKSHLLSVKKQLDEYGDLVSIQLFSALKKTGIEALQAKLDSWLLPLDTEDSVIGDK